MTAGELPADADAAAMAGLVMAVVQGMSTLARDGASREHLLAVAGAAMAGWPEVPTRRRSEAGAGNDGWGMGQAMQDGGQA